MKRTSLIIIAILALTIPGPAVAAQATPSSSQPDPGSLDRFTLTATDLGEGWRRAETTDGPDTSPDQPATYSIYFGPDGARLQINMFVMPASFSARAERWERLREQWQSWADYLNDPYANSADERTTASPATISLPAVVDDGLRFGGFQPLWHTHLAVGLYIFDSGPAAFIILDGSILPPGDLVKLNGVNALDHIVTLIAAKQ